LEPGRGGKINVESEKEGDRGAGENKKIFCFDVTGRD